MTRPSILARRAVNAVHAGFRRFLVAAEPWYDYGQINVTNMEARTEAEVADGEVSYFDLQWFGFHVGFQLGRTPRLAPGVAESRAAADEPEPLPPCELDLIAWNLADRNWTAARVAAVEGKWEDDVADAEREAWRALMDLRAPHVRALHWKLDQLFSESQKTDYSDSWDNSIIRGVVADARRLASQER